MGRKLVKMGYGVKLGIPKKAVEMASFMDWGK